MDKGDCAFIKLDSVMDVEKAEMLEREFEKLVFSGKKKIYLDFSHVGFLCSHMLRVFVRFHKTWSRSGIKIGIQSINDFSKYTLKISGLENLFTLSSDWKDECGLQDN